MRICVALFGVVLAMLPAAAPQSVPALSGSADSRAPYRVALPGYRYQFPRDNFNHPDFQTEWWYYTGNLRGVDGHRFGFELTFFRQGLARGTNLPSAVAAARDGQPDGMQGLLERREPEARAGASA